MKFLKATPAANGYPRVTLCRSGKNHYRHLHVLICSLFNGPRPSEEHEVGHRDGVRSHVSAENLRWVTFEGNMLDKQRHGMAAKKLTADQVREIRLRIGRGETPKSLAQGYSVNRSSIERIARGETWAWLT